MAKKKTFEEKCLELQKPFAPDEISWRVQRKWGGRNGNFAHLLAYIDSRAIFDMLDNVIGAGNWRNRKRKITLIKEEIVTEYKNGKNVEVVDDSGKPVTRTITIDGMIDTLELKNDEGEWVGKEDGAEPRDIHSFKSACSDSIKRAAVLWGIGRYLYYIKNVIVKMTPEKPKGTQGVDFDFVRHNKENWYYEIPKSIIPYIPKSMKEKLANIVKEIEDIEKKYAKIENTPEPEPEPEPKKKETKKEKKEVKKEETPKEEEKLPNFFELTEITASDTHETVVQKIKTLVEALGKSYYDEKVRIFQTLKKEGKVSSNNKKLAESILNRFIEEEREALYEVFGIENKDVPSAKKETKDKPNDKEKKDKDVQAVKYDKSLLDEEGDRNALIARMISLSEAMGHDKEWTLEQLKLISLDTDILTASKNNKDAGAKLAFVKFKEKFAKELGL